MTPKVSDHKSAIHADSCMGQCDSGTKLVKIPQGYKATTRITHVFGSEIQGGELEAYGVTEEQALQRLDEERRKFNDSLWA